MNDVKSWYEIIFQYWSQITVLLTAIGFLIKVFFDYRIRKKEIIFTKLKENRILEYKAFLQAYHLLYVNLCTLQGDIDKTKDHNSYFSDIRKGFIEFESQALIINLLSSNEDQNTIEQIRQAANRSRVLMFSIVHGRLTEYTPTDIHERYDEIEKILYTTLPELINEIPLSIRRDFGLKG